MPKQKKRSTWAVKNYIEPVRLSQCMIVKNEEKNIELALSWAKDIAFEQIVVDTGSTDRTVELARKCGAIVYDFKWINDFSAAKNYAIEKAKGNWIAFLDADEYFSKDDAQKLFAVLKKLQSPDQKHIDYIRTSIAHLNDLGKPFMVNVQDRVFRNLPKMRYHGSIHEQIKPLDGNRLIFFDQSAELTIFHTGYMQSTYSSTNKSLRNVEIIREELAKDPDNIDLVGYLGESLVTAKLYDEALVELQKVVDAGHAASNQRLRQAFSYIGRICLEAKRDPAFLIGHFSKALQAFPDHYDYLLGLGIAYRRNMDDFLALEYFEKCEEILRTATQAQESYLVSRPEILFSEAMAACISLEDTHGIIRFGTLLLRREKFFCLALNEVLKQLYDAQGEQTDDQIIFDLLTKLYDFNELKDKLYVLKEAKRLEKEGLEQLVMDTFTDEQKNWLNEKQEEVLDNRFFQLMQKLYTYNERELVDEFIQSIKSLPDEDFENMQNAINQLNYWGKLSVEEGEYEAFIERARVLKSRHYDFCKLYCVLEDVRSKNVLYAIMANLLVMDFRSLIFAKEKTSEEYFDNELILTSPEEVFVDAGAYNGDTSYSFINTYKNYGKIFCYEPTPALFGELCKYMGKYPNMELRKKAVGEAAGEGYLLTDNADGALNRVTLDKPMSLSEDEQAQTVEIVALDEDIDEQVDFIKLDVEGMEVQALSGAKKLIANYKPKLAVAAYHTYDQILDAAQKITELNPDYKLYLRYYGGNLLPSEYALIAINSSPVSPDWRFCDTMAEIKASSEQKLLSGMIDAYSKLKDEDKESFKTGLNTQVNPGCFEPESENYELFSLRAKFLKAHSEDLQELYDTLVDTESKNALYAVIVSWLNLDFKPYEAYSEKYAPKNFDPRIFPFVKDEVYVDAGAGVGDSIAAYARVFGSYKKVFAYEIAESSLDGMKQLLNKYENVSYINKGVGQAEGEMVFQKCESDLRLNRLASLDDVQAADEPDKELVRVQTVALDDDIDEEVGFIKLHIEGMELEALKGCERHIRNSKPRLSVCLSHRLSDLVEIPRLIRDYNPEYSLYLRLFESAYSPDILIYGV